MQLCILSIHRSAVWGKQMIVLHQIWHELPQRWSQQMLCFLILNEIGSLAYIYFMPPSRMCESRINGCLTIFQVFASGSETASSIYVNRVNLWPFLWRRPNRGGEASGMPLQKYWHFKSEVIDGEPRSFLDIYKSLRVWLKLGKYSNVFPVSFLK